MNSENSKYDTEWFKKRAFDSLVPLAPHVWDYSDSLLLYISSGVEKYESLQEEDTPYFRLVTKPEREYLQSIAKDACEMLPNGFDYIDLGPGTEHKEQFFLMNLRNKGRNSSTFPSISALTISSWQKSMLQTKVCLLVLYGLLLKRWLKSSEKARGLVS